MFQDPRQTDTDAEVRFLPRAKAATYVQAKYGFPCSPRWLAKLAVVGGGPRFLKSGRNPVYAPSDLDAWALARLGIAGTDGERGGGRGKA